MQKWFFFIIIISTTFWNCQQPSTANVETKKSVTLGEPPMSSASEADFKADSVSSSLADKLEEKSESKQKTPSVISPQNAVRKVIRTADLRFKVAKTDNATYKIETLATHFKGYVTQSQMNSRVLSEKSMVVSNDSMLQSNVYNDLYQCHIKYLKHYPKMVAFFKIIALHLPLLKIIWVNSL